jgi:acyl carrier protein
VSTPAERIKHILDDILGLGDRASELTAATPLLGEMPELDSMAVLQLAMAIEREFGLTIPDEDFGAELFATVGSLTGYVEARMRRPMPLAAVV